MRWVQTVLIRGICGRKRSAFLSLNTYRFTINIGQKPLLFSENSSTDEIVNIRLPENHFVFMTYRPGTKSLSDNLDQNKPGLPIWDQARYWGERERWWQGLPGRIPACSTELSWRNMYVKAEVKKAMPVARHNWTCCPWVLATCTGNGEWISPFRKFPSEHSQGWPTTHY